MAEDHSPAGKLFGHYRILGQLGAGGMGVVYSAYDTILERKVAIKVVGDRVLADKSARDLLLHEARAASALNHPNICTIHQVGDSEGIAYIVMEQVEGQPFSSLWAAGGLSPDLVIRYGMQIADALAHAHKHGVIHRDLKSTNALVTAEGRVKVLDFGLAARLKDTELQEAVSSLVPLTESRMIVGTLPYLAPELLRGEPADARTDIWALGVLLYEMASGTHPFHGRTTFELSSAILRDPPMPLPASVPPSLGAVILRCLEKSPGERYQRAGEVRSALDSLGFLSVPRATIPTIVSRQGARKNIRLRAAMAAAVAVLVAGAIWLSKPVQSPTVNNSTQLTSGGKACCLMVTDGFRLYFREELSSGPVLAQVSVAGGDISQLPPSISHPVIEDISADRTHLLITTFDSNNAPFWNLPLPAGAPRRIGDIEGGWASWAPDGKHLIFSRDSGLYIASANGSDAKKIVSGAQGNLGQLRFSPDGSRIRFTVFNREAETETLWEVRADGSDLHRLLPGWRNPPNECCGQWTPDGRYYVFESAAGHGAHDIFAIRESQRLFSTSTSRPIRLTFGPLRFEGPVVSLDEKKLFAFGWHQRGELVHYDSGSRQIVPFLGGISATDVCFSRDGKWIAYVGIPGYDLWRSRVDGSERVQLTSSDGNTSALPRWSPDGKQIAYMSRVIGKPWRIFLISADGGMPTPLLPDSAPESDPTWSADGSQLAYATGFTSSMEKSDIEIVNLNTRQSSSLPGSSGLFSPRWSPDGHYLAALSFEYPAKKIFLYDFRAQKWAQWIEDEDVGYLAWTSDSRYLQYVQHNSGDTGSKVRRVKVGDSHPQDVFSLKSLRRYDGIAGFWSDTAPDSSRMFVRDTSGRDIYAFDIDFH
jgi:serine/threonine protein kinase/Tol biopolymer transport system component